MGSGSAETERALQKTGLPTKAVSGFCRSRLVVTKGAEQLPEGPSEVPISGGLSRAAQVSGCDLMY